MPGTELNDDVDGTVAMGLLDEWLPGPGDKFSVRPPSRGSGGDSRDGAPHARGLTGTERRAAMDEPDVRRGGGGGIPSGSPVSAPALMWSTVSGGGGLPPSPIVRPRAVDFFTMDDLPTAAMGDCGSGHGGLDRAHAAAAPSGGGGGGRNGDESAASDQREDNNSGGSGRTREWREQRERERERRHRNWHAGATHPLAVAPRSSSAAEKSNSRGNSAATANGERGAGVGATIVGGGSAGGASVAAASVGRNPRPRSHLHHHPHHPSSTHTHDLVGGGGDSGLRSGDGGGGHPLNPSGEQEGCDARSAHELEREHERVLSERDVGADAKSRRHLAEAKVVAEAKRAAPLKEHLRSTEQHAQTAQGALEHWACMARATEPLDRLDRLDRCVPSLTYSLPLTAAAASPHAAAAVSDHRNGRTLAVESIAANACSDSTEEWLQKVTERSSPFLAPPPFAPERSSPFLALMEAREHFHTEAQERFRTAAAVCGGLTNESSFIAERSSPFLALMEARERFREFIILYDLAREWFISLMQGARERLILSLRDSCAPHGGARAIHIKFASHLVHASSRGTQKLFGDVQLDSLCTYL